MSQPVLFVTGFEPFLDVRVNASGELVKLLDGMQIGDAMVRGVVLPVSFQGMPQAYDAALEALEPDSALALCSLGVHREGYFRLEQRARPILKSDKPDADGVLAADIDPLGSAELRTSVDLPQLMEALRGGGATDVRLSDDAGGYVCERCCWHLLQVGQERQVPAVFLHVPPEGTLAASDQLAPVIGMLHALLSQA